MRTIRLGVRAIGMIEGRFTIEVQSGPLAPLLARILFDWMPDDGEDRERYNINIPRIVFEEFDRHNAANLRDGDVLRAVLDLLVDYECDSSWSEAFERLRVGRVLMINLPVRKAARR